MRTIVRVSLRFLPLLFLSTVQQTLAQNYAQDIGEAVQRTRTSDSSLVQEYAGHFGWSIDLPSEDIAKFNKLGSKLNEAGQTEVVNFMLRGGLGGVTIKYYTEQRMLPLGYGMLDSTIFFYQSDSTGRNGHIYRRVYVMNQQSVEIEVMLTDKGQETLQPSVMALLDSFTPPADAIFTLEEWRFGRNPEDYREGRYPAGGGPTRK